MNIKTFCFNPFQENTILLWDNSGEGVIVDPGCYDSSEVSAIADYMGKEGISPKMILLTHGHFDHIYGAAPLAERYGIPVYMHPADRTVVEHSADYTAPFRMKTPEMFATVDIKEGDVLTCGGFRFKVIETPGHTPGGVCYHDETNGVLLSGDTLFAGSIGRSDFPGGDYDKLIVSIMDKVMGLDTDTDVIPGHGPSTNIGQERTHNPFLQPFNEKDEDSGEVEGISIDGGMQ